MFFDVKKKRTWKINFPGLNEFDFNKLVINRSNDFQIFPLESLSYPLEVDWKQLIQNLPMTLLQNFIHFPVESGTTKRCLSFFQWSWFSSRQTIPVDFLWQFSLSTSSWCFFQTPSMQPAFFSNCLLVLSTVRHSKETNKSPKSTRKLNCRWKRNYNFFSLSFDISSAQIYDTF